MKEKLIGAWKLKSYTAIDDKGCTIYPFGHNAKGFIIYSAEGYMSATLFNPDLIDSASAGISRKDISSGNCLCMSYAGPYNVVSNKVLHNIETSNIPEMIATAQERLFSIKENALTIKAETVLEGVKYSHTLIWVK